MRQTVRITAPVLVGPAQMRRTVPAGSIVQVVTYTTDGKYAYVQHQRSCGYVLKSSVTAV